MGDFSTKPRPLPIYTQVRFKGYTAVAAEGRGFQHRHEYIPVAYVGDVLSPTLLETSTLDPKVSP